MFKLKVDSKFSAAHKLVGYNGKCEKLHGHTWKVEIFVIGKKLNDIGILIDFKLLKKALSKITEKFDHSYLNDFKEIGNPSSENISKYIFHNLKLPGNISLERVRVWEGDGAYAEYFEE